MTTIPEPATTEVPPFRIVPNHWHPDHTCRSCLAAENEMRVGFEPDHRELHPDYVPPRKGAA